MKNISALLSLLLVVVTGCTTGHSRDRGELRARALGTTLTWDPPIDGNVVEGYRLEAVLKAASGRITTNSIVVSTNAVTVTLTNLGNGVHDFRLFTTNSFGEGPPSNTARLWASPPSPASNLRYINMSNP